MMWRIEGKIMVEGFWIVQYEGLQGNGGGVAVFTKGHIFGGDSGSTYIGTYQADARGIKARVRVHNYMPGVASIVGIEGDYELDVSGTVEGGVIRASGTPIGHNVSGMALKLTRAANLPA
jgi:hypothetical protein